MFRKLSLFLPFLLLCLTSTMAYTMMDDNPFFKQWNTPFGTPPFSEIKLEHYMPAFLQGMKEQKAEIEAIVNNKEKPTFENTVVAMEKSGALLTKVSRVFGHLSSANTNDDMQKIAEESGALLAKHSDDIYLNEALFKRVKVIYAEKDKLHLTTEQKMVLENYYLDFVRSGANLTEAKKAKLRKINEEMSSVVLKFGDNVRKENSKFELVVSKKEDLAGLPETSIQPAAEKAKAKNLTNKWIFTIDKPTLLPFLQYAENRDLREKMYKAYMNRGNNNDELDNKAIFKKILTLRIEKAKLLGYKNYAAFVVSRKMAKTPEKVEKFLHDMWKPTVKHAKAEVAEMQKIVDKEGKKFKIAPWDWWFYSEKVKKEKYALDEEMIRPYFKLENVLQGAFAVAGKLYGLQFTERSDIQLYHPDVKVFEVKEADGKHLGILYTDYFPRESKVNGAWCGALRDQSNIDGNAVSPVIYNVGNFSKPTGDKPALLSEDEVRTLFHEFGHGLHGLFQNVHYPSAANVPSDFVELPSQIMEKWAMKAEVLKMYAKHYKTGEVIPDNLIEKIKNAQYFNQGFETLEYIAASILDMDWHVLTNAKDLDIAKFEKNSMKKMGLIPEILPRYMTTNFIHIATWGYEAGYYSYLWSAILDADAFSAFEEKGIFDGATAQSFRNNILSKGGSDDLNEMFKRFRGREPKVDALLKSRGLF
ncbi:MAG: M3 family metallopeptidase [Ignavibacteria bacterium]|nr:M3 family metallopeptidase [Ignavibacteria bacterium]